MKAVAITTTVAIVMTMASIALWRHNQGLADRVNELERAKALVQRSLDNQRRVCEDAIAAQIAARAEAEAVRQRLNEMIKRRGETP